MLRFGRPPRLGTEHRLIGNYEQPDQPATAGSDNAKRTPPDAIKDRPLDALQNGLTRQQAVHQRLQELEPVPGASQVVRSTLRQRQSPAVVPGLPHYPAFRQQRQNTIGTRLNSLPGLRPGQPASPYALNRVQPFVRAQMNLRANAPQPRRRGSQGNTSQLARRPTMAARLSPPGAPQEAWLTQMDERLNARLRLFNVSLMQPNQSRVINNRERDPAGMSTFDLPRNEPIGYVGLYDGVEPWEVPYMNSFPGLMNRAGYQFVVGPRAVQAANQDPIGMLRQQLQQLESQGVRYTYLYLVPHGTPDGRMVFHLPGGGSVYMQSSEVAALTREFRTMRFYININSCYGGGISADHFHDPTVTDRVPRVTVNTQSNSRTPTAVMMLGEEGVSFFDAILSRYIRQGVAYGQASLLAGETVQRLFTNRPGMIPTFYRSGRGRATTTTLPSL